MQWIFLEYAQNTLIKLVIKTLIGITPYAIHTDGAIPINCFNKLIR